MGKHSLPDTTPYELFNYHLYSSPMLRDAILAEGHSAYFDKTGDIGHRLTADWHANQVVMQANTIRERLMLAGMDPEHSQRFEGIFGGVMQRTVEGRHAHDPSNGWHADIPPRTEGQSWMSWLIHDAPSNYVLEFVQTFEEAMLPPELRATTKQQPHPIGTVAVHDNVA